MKEEIKLKTKPLELEIKPRESLISIKYSKEDWKEQYTLRCRIGLRIFSWIFPAVLRIYIK